MRRACGSGGLQLQVSAAAQLRHTPNNISVILQFLTLKLQFRVGRRERRASVRGKGSLKQAEVAEVNEPLAMTAAAAGQDVPQRVSCSFQVCLTRARRRRLCLPTEDQVEFRKPWHVSVPLLPLDARRSMLDSRGHAPGTKSFGRTLLAGICTCCFDFKASLACGPLNCLRNRPSKW